MALFVYWGQGKDGPGTNPVYSIEAASLEEALAYARTQHKAVRADQVRPDDGTAARYRLGTPMNLWRITPRPR